MKSHPALLLVAFNCLLLPMRQLAQPVNRPSQEEWNQITTDGTPTNLAWQQQVDGIASQ
jgi:hypothetical protein